MNVECLELRRLLAADVGALLNMPGLVADPASYDSGSILVRFREDPAAQPRTSTHRDASVLAGRGAESLLSWLPELQRIQVPAELDVESVLAMYQNHPDVLYAEPDYRLYATAIPDDPRFTEMWDHENTGQTGGTSDADIDSAGAWDVHTGSGSMVVAVIDTGVDYLHPDLGANTWVNPGEIAGDGIDNDGNGYVDDFHGYDFVNRDGDPMDDQGHGTHVAGTIGAVGNNGVGVTGINWNVQIMALKFLGADGSGTSSDAIEAINYAVANGARLSNNSWGGDPPSQAMYDAIALAREAGHVFVAAAGNGDWLGIGIDNDATPFYPSGYELDNIVSVAATDHNDHLATFSNYGATTVDLAAPGVNILSTTRGGGYGLNSGTSMAAPHVAGVLALVWDAHPDWTYDQVIAQVLNTVDPLPNLQGLVATGGRLNAAAALDNPQPPPPPPPPGTLPLLEDFQDQVANYLDPQTGNWSVSGGRYDVAPAAANHELAAISLLRLDGSLPADVELRTSVTVDEGRLDVFGFVLRDYLTNAFVVFDYTDANDFKFAGPDMDADRWVIGHRDGSGWHTDAAVPATLQAGTRYDLRVVMEEGNHVTLQTAGVTLLEHAYSESLVDGRIGIGTRNAAAHFDDLLARAFVAPTAGHLPLSEDFDDGVAEHFVEAAGIALVQDNQVTMVPALNADAVATLWLGEAFPAGVEVESVINARPAADGRYSNAFVVFDYQSPTDFKFAGGYVGTGQWLVGRRTTSGWLTDHSVDVPLTANTDYHLQVLLVDDEVSLIVDGSQQLNYSFGESVLDGQLGLATKNAVSGFDDFAVQEFAPPAATNLPYAEDFEDGTADHLAARSGQWSVDNGRYGVVPAVDADGISTLRLERLPAELFVEAVVSADAAVDGRYSNAFLIFDYHGPTDFKFAGAYVGGDNWAIGHRDASGWVDDVLVDAGSIHPLTDYRLRVALEQQGVASLWVNGVPQARHTFSDPLTDGAVGVGTRDALSRFDDVVVQEVQPPDPPTPGVLPVAEDFGDGNADHFVIHSGQATVLDNRYLLSAPLGGDGISTILLADALPANTQIEASFSAAASSATRYSNAFIIFDYQSATDFKFAGAYVGGGQWLIGHRTATDWVTDRAISGSLSPSTDYHMQVMLLENGSVQLAVDGAELIAYEYGGLLTDGLVGLGTKNADSRFDDVLVQAYAPPPSATLPHSEDFADGVADFFVPRVGEWWVEGGRYRAVPTLDGDAITTLRVANLPADVELSATINADAAVDGRYSNAFLVFDYRSPTDFKYAGAYVGGNKWAIGHRTASGWVDDVTLNAGSIDVFSDYQLHVALDSTNRVTLSVNGVSKLSRNYGDTLVDGELGLGTFDALSRFDDVRVEKLTPPPSASVPYSEDFDDGVADFWDPQSGTWTIGSGRYEVVPPTNKDGISLLAVTSLPTNFQVQTVMNANAGGNGRYSNAFVIFDYQSPTDFKYAGAYVGGKKWVLGHRTAAGWVDDATTNVTVLNTLTDYHLLLTVIQDTQVTLAVNGNSLVSHSFSGSLRDGKVGLGTNNAVSRFDDVAVSEFSASGQQVLATATTEPASTQTGGVTLASVAGHPSTPVGQTSGPMMETGFAPDAAAARQDLARRAIRADAALADWDELEVLLKPSDWWERR